MLTSDAIMVGAQHCCAPARQDRIRQHLPFSALTTALSSWGHPARVPWGPQC